MTESRLTGRLLYLAAILAVLTLCLGCAGEPTPVPPRNPTIYEAQQFIPFPIRVPTHFPEGYVMDEAVDFLDGPDFGHETKGVGLALRKYAPDGYENIYIRQFLAEGMFAPTRLYLEGIVSWEVVDIGNHVVVVKEAELGGGSRVIVEWETEHEGKRVFWSVDSAVTKEETFLIIGSFRSVFIRLL